MLKMSYEAFLTLDVQIVLLHSFASTINGPKN